ncbi:hypothetical protein [Streptomyces rubiginosohelvolus]|uniref:hypothetical protein n=1 Tax=Streptomyces rubiginosohelvolus TaxID=67362 RepID=UPI0035D56992
MVARPAIGGSGDQGATGCSCLAGAESSAQGQHSRNCKECPAAQGGDGRDGEAVARGEVAEAGADAAVGVERVGLVDGRGVGEGDVREGVARLAVGRVDGVAGCQGGHDLPGLRGAFEGPERTGWDCNLDRLVAAETGGDPASVDFGEYHPVHKQHYLDMFS